MLDQFDIASLTTAVEHLGNAVRGLEPAELSAEEAAQLVKLFARVERLGAAGRTLASRVVERSGAWRREGYRTAAHWVSVSTGVPVGKAVGGLETARWLEAFPSTTQAFRSGELSEAPVTEVAAAAAVAPQSEAELLEAARTEAVRGLRDRCRLARAAAIDENEAYDHIRRERYLKHWTDMEGAFRLEARLTPDDGASRGRDRASSGSGSQGKQGPGDVGRATRRIWRTPWWLWPGRTARPMRTRRGARGR